MMIPMVLNSYKTFIPLQCQRLQETLPPLW